ncbi:hypothetical protein LTR64_006301 [Lithohypha guttulata]|uniref:Uncharacterized protein n=1 Tax=Lithohypha guttulata TaxID=1690604 RepID=A0AAN7T623_9EURO|nr:hypothetical protein LTR51_001901 [Lithohypha guttulata]KAK5090367.1 hypothetical protein LTR05_000539 [Lithohypha guttulata]
MTANSGIPVCTAAPEQSIWRDLPEREFRHHLIDLERRTNAVPANVQIFTPSNDFGAQDLNHVGLSFTIEQQLADDLAFIAAVKEGAQSVAAVCLEQHLSPVSRLVVRIAAADTIDNSVRSAMASVCSNLSKVSTYGSFGESKSATEILWLIIEQHQAKLLGRLRSERWDKPKYLAESHKKPLWQDFANVIHRVQHVYPARKQKHLRKRLVDRLNELAQCYENFELTPDTDLVQQLCILTTLTHAFCKDQDIQDFASELEQIRPTAQIAGTLKCLRQLEKIGAYWRIAVDLVACANKFPRVLRNIELEYLSSYSSVPAEIAYESWAKTCHVHAEIQLVIDHDLRHSERVGSMMDEAVVLWPRTVGTSKYLCYLCHLFINLHGCFFAPNTHGRLYDQWTVPDLKEFDHNMRDKYRGVLGRMNAVITKQAALDSCWRAEPMTSRQNLLSQRD